MSQTDLNNTAEKVAETVVPAVEETTAAATEPVVEAVNEGESKRKSFFDIFKRKSDTEEVKTEEAAATTEGEAAATETEAPAEVPVEDGAAKKTGLCCGLCSFGKKAEEAKTEEATEETKTEEVTEETKTEEATEEPATEAKEATPVAETKEATPVVAAAEEPVVTEETTAEEPVEAVTEADIARSGTLFKSGKFFKNRMNERHCRLLHTGVFQWSKTEDFTKAHEVKMCKDTNLVAFMAEGEETAHKYRFELHCCKDVMTFACDTEEDRDEWVRAFETVKEKVVPAEEEAAPAATEEVAAE